MQVLDRSAAGQLRPLPVDRVGQNEPVAAESVLGVRHLAQPGRDGVVLGLHVVLRHGRGPEPLVEVAPSVNGASFVSFVGIDGKVMT